MEIFENIAEYYDELFPISESQKKFYEEISKDYSKPVKYLRVNCGTGTFEHQLAKNGADVTGLETIPDLLESANRKHRTQLMALRFFQMTTLEMSRFLGKGFYNVISILHDRLIFIHDETLLKKIFFDCKLLASEKGRIVISIPNFEKYSSKQIEKLPVKESIRAKLFSKIITEDSGKKYFEQFLETGNGKIIPVTRDAEIFPIKRDKIEEFAKEAGFSKIEFYSDFDKTDFNADSDNLIAVIS